MYGNFEKTIITNACILIRSSEVYELYKVYVCADVLMYVCIRQERAVAGAEWKADIRGGPGPAPRHPHLGHLPGAQLLHGGWDCHVGCEAQPHPGQRFAFAYTLSAIDNIHTYFEANNQVIIIKKYLLMHSFKV
jgi:hypothetical protein